MVSDWTYDIEVYPNLFTATFQNVHNLEEFKEFIIYTHNENVIQNDRYDLIEFVNQCRFLIGYNSLAYDDGIINLLLFGKFSRNINQEIYNASIQIVTSDFITREIMYLRYKQPYKSIDLMSVLGFNKLFISLKQVAINLKWHRIQDLPIHYQSYIEPEQIPLIMDYNRNDVKITSKLYDKLKPEIRLRFDVGKVYNVDLMNASNSNIGNTLLDTLYARETGAVDNQFKAGRTNRSSVNIGDILDSKVKFQTAAMQKMHEYLKDYVIEIDKKEDQSKAKKKPLYNLIFNGKRYTIAKGGLHSDNPAKIYEETNDVSIITADVASYYPNLIIKLQAAPKHLGEHFLRVYNIIIQDRLVAKKELGSKSPKAEALKISANAVYGKLNYPYYWLYDPKAAYTVTMNGQMFLLMLVERLELAGIECIAANTDGIECRVRKDQEELYYSICKDWEDELGYVLEYDYYSKLVIRDVNNYISITRSGKVKEKGTFLTKRSSISLVDELKRAFDMPIISEALFKYFSEGISVEDTISNHKDIYDFCSSQKMGSKFKAELHQIIYNEHDMPIYNIVTLQKTNRYYISSSLQGELTGILKKRDVEKSIKPTDSMIVSEQSDITSTSLGVSNLASGQYVTIFNDYIDKSMEEYNIDYNYYITEAKKIILTVTNNFQYDLFK